MVNNIDLGRKDISNKLMTLGSDRKKSSIPLFNIKRSCLKKISSHDTEKEESGSRHCVAR